MVGAVFRHRNYFTRRKNHDLDNLDPDLPFCDVRVCVVHIQPREPVLDHGCYRAPTRQHEPDHTWYRLGTYLT